MFRKNYTDQEIIQAAQQSASCAELLRRLNLKPVGGNYETMKKKLSKLSVDCSHWTGQQWNKGKKLKNWGDYSRSSSVKAHLIKELGHKCENCLISLWYDEPICLELHHIDGDRTNNTFDNLKLLCPNCHSMTKNWRGKKNATASIVDKVLVNRVNPQLNIVRKKKIKEVKLSKTHTPPTKINWPDKESLEQMIKSNSMLSLSKLLGVSDNAIRKRAQKYGIDIKAVSAWSKIHAPQSITGALSPPNVK